MSLIDQEQKYLLFRSEEVTDHHKERNDHKRGQHFVTLSYDNIIVENEYKVLPEAMVGIYRASYQDLKTFYNSTTEELSSFVPFVTLYLITGSGAERQTTRLYFGDPSSQTSVGAITSPSHINHGAGITRLTVNKESDQDAQTYIDTPSLQGDIEFKLTNFNQLFVNRTDQQDAPCSLSKLLDLRRLDSIDRTVNHERTYPKILIEYGWTIPGDENATRAGFWRDSFQAMVIDHDIEISEDGSISVTLRFSQSFSENVASRNILMSNVNEQEEINFEQYTAELRQELERNRAAQQEARMNLEAVEWLRENYGSRQGFGEAHESIYDPEPPVQRDVIIAPDTRIRFPQDMDEDLKAAVRRILHQGALQDNGDTLIIFGTHENAFTSSLRERFEILEQQGNALSLQLAEEMSELYSRFLLSLYNKGRIYYVDIPSEITNAEAIRQAQAARRSARMREVTPQVAGLNDPMAVAAAQQELINELSNISIPDEEIAYKFCASPDKFGVVPQQDIENIRTASAGEIDRAAEDQAREVDAETRNTDNPGTLVKDTSNFLNQASSEYDPPEENTKRVQYLLLGDIIDSAMAFVGREDLVEDVRDPRLILGPVDLRTLGANISSEKYASSYNIPISLRAFNSFFFREYINKEEINIRFQGFVTELYRQIVGLNYPVVDGDTLTTEPRPNPRSSLHLHSFRVPTNKDITNGQVISTPPYRGHRNFTMPDISTDMSNLTAGLNKKTYHYISILRGNADPTGRSTPRGPFPLTSIDVNHDAAARFGVPSLFYGTDKSIVKSVNYSSESPTDPAEEAALLTQGFAGRTKLYTVNIETFGNSYFHPYDYFWLEPTNITGPGEGNYRQIRQSLYDHKIMHGYRANKVTEEITLDGYYTTFNGTYAPFQTTEDDNRRTIACEEAEATPEASPTPTPPATTPPQPSTSAVRVVDQRLAPGGRGPFRIDLDTPSSSSETLYFPLQNPRRQGTGYGYSNTYNNSWGGGNTHDAIDIFPIGAGNNDSAQQKSIFSIISGTVAAVERRHRQDETWREAAARHPDMRQGNRTGKGGNYVVIHSLDRKIRIYYAHLAPDSIPDSIRPGATVSAGQVLGKVGRTGSAYKPRARTKGEHHLHIDIKVVDTNGRLRRINPFDVLNLLQGDRNTGESPASLEDLYNYLNVSYDARGNRTGPGPREAQIRAAHPESEDS